MPNLKESESNPEEDTSLLPVESDDGSPKPRAKKPCLKEPGSETPTQTPAPANHTETEEPSTPPRPVKKSQETPHSSPVEKIKPVEAAGSDTDSATEDISPPEQNTAVKRKVTEQRTPEKKIRLDRKGERKMLSPVKTPLLEKYPEKKSEVVQKPEEHPSPTLSSPSKDIELKSEMPALTREVHLRVEPLCPELEDPTTTTNEEMMPQIGPEALVCHEVDLDDPEEKDRPSGEELLIMMKEAKARPLEMSDQLPHVLAAVGPPRLFSPSSAPSPDESHSTKSESDATIEVDSVAESQEGLGESESTHSFDASASSSNSSISLQDRDGKDRGRLKLDAHLGYIHMKPELSPSDLVFPSSQEISASTRNHETDTKQCSIHARPVCGAVILPHTYTKNREDLDYAQHKPCARYPNEHGTIHLSYWTINCICDNIAIWKNTIFQPQRLRLHTWQVRVNRGVWLEDRLVYDIKVQREKA